VFVKPVVVPYRIGGFRRYKGASPDQAVYDVAVLVRLAYGVVTREDKAGEPAVLLRLGPEPLIDGFESLSGPSPS
jgi:hypothetical protein